MPGLFNNSYRDDEQDLMMPEYDPTMAMLEAQGAAPLVGAFNNNEAVTAAAGLKPITDKTVAEAVETLTKYKLGKANLESRVVEEELWWELQHWEVLRKEKHPESPEPTSAWLFNTITSKHADAMDNYPEPVLLAREKDDEQSAKILSSVVPVVLENSSFREVYDDLWYEKLKHGTAVYGAFWNPSKDGIGDIEIQGIDLLKIFWEPGITDIQKSRNLFIVDLVDEDLLDMTYPQYKGKMGGSVIDVKQYVYDDTIDTEHKSVVVDWYYKKQNSMGKEIVHYVKFVGAQLLYASENDPEYADRGWYDHGKYPVVFDILFPEKGTPVGFGYVSVCKDPQLYIDKLSGNILESSLIGTKHRYFASSALNINEDEFLDWNQPIIHCEGEINENRLRELIPHPLDGIYVNVMQMKIEEMKETASNRDSSNGGSTSGVTAAAAIAALQESGNKTSRDMISRSYNNFTNLVKMCLELIRQFYDEQRAFRIIGNDGAMQYIMMSNAMISQQPTGLDAEGNEMYRLPVFDVKVSAQKKNPFSRMEQNERAKELYGMGFFNPERAQEALVALEMMDFEGIDKVRERVEQGQTLLQICNQQQQIIASLTGGMMGGQPMPGPGMAQGGPAPQPKVGGGKFASGIMEANTPMTGYGERLAKRSTPSME